MKNKKSVIYNFSNKPQLFIINDRVVNIKGDNVAYINKENSLICDYNGCCKGIIINEKVVDREGFLIGKIGETDNEVKLKLKKEPIRPLGAGDCWNDNVEQKEEWKKIDLFNLFVLE